MRPKVEVLNVNAPDHVVHLDAGKYNAMREALLEVLPHAPPGLTAAEALEALKPALPDSEFPGGKTAGWWMKSVQLDLEARGLIARTASRPLRLYRAAKP